MFRPPWDLNLPLDASSRFLKVQPLGLRKGLVFESDAGTEAEVDVDALLPVSFVNAQPIKDLRVLSSGAVKLVISSSLRTVVGHFSRVLEK